MPPSNTLSAFKLLILVAVNCRLLVSVASLLLTTRILSDAISTCNPLPFLPLLAITVASNFRVAASKLSLPASTGKLTSLPSVLNGLLKKSVKLVNKYCEGAFDIAPAAGRKMAPSVTLKVLQLASRAPVPMSVK